MKIRKYLGMHGCGMCSKRVRVWDWLPAIVLCAECQKRVERQEKAQQSKENKQ